MNYAAHVSHPPQVLVVGSVALVIGAGAALGISAIAENDPAIPDAGSLVMPQTSATHNEGAAATGTSGGAATDIPGASPTAVTHNEATTAAGVSSGSANDADVGGASGKDEAATAAAVGD
jgi:hypothetical protein